jgi:hypothetical protein
MIDTYNTDGRITFVGNRFIDGDGNIWDILTYSEELDEYTISRFNANSPIGGRLDAKSFRKAWISNTIKILGEWWLPK